MAFRNRYRMQRRSGYGRARSFGRVAMGYGRRRFAGRGRGIAGIGLKYGAGMALGYFAPRVHPMQDLIITAAAVLPMRLPYGAKGVCQGYVMGMIVKNFLPSIGGFTGAVDTFTV